MEKEKIDRRKIGTAYEQEAVLFLTQKHNKNLIIR